MLNLSEEEKRAIYEEVRQNYLKEDIIHRLDEQNKAYDETRIQSMIHFLNDHEDAEDLWYKIDNAYDETLKY